MTGTPRAKEEPFEPGLIPVPGALLVWRDSRHFDRFRDLPRTLCVPGPHPCAPTTVIPRTRRAAEDWISAHPVEDRLGRFASDVQPKPKSKGQGDDPNA
ncbi:hypothetical protein [Streptomyces sp. NPDC057794]|uniref:hypothetical protein n=1 Tax=Streptomyces sp. NPDC057794 TaxID=3346251 RepID=UPI0036BCD129